MQSFATILKHLNLHYYHAPDFPSHSHLKSNLHRNHRLPSDSANCPYHRHPLAACNFDSLFLFS